MANWGSSDLLVVKPRGIFVAFIRKALESKKAYWFHKKNLKKNIVYRAKYTFQVANAAI